MFLIWGLDDIHLYPFTPVLHPFIAATMWRSGRFPRAVGFYRQGLFCASQENRPALESRLRLAAAMLGQSTDGPAAASGSTPAAFGEVRLAADAFEQLLRKTRQVRGLAGVVFERPIVKGTDSCPCYSPLPRNATELQ